jgi:plasmid stabilization system protein ParE
MHRHAVVFTPRAQRQLDSLYAAIAAHGGEPTADNYVGGIVTACLSLATFPERGTKRDDIRPILRTMGYARRVTVAFSVDAATRTVAIHGVFYGGQDFEQLLRDSAGDD